MNDNRSMVEEFTIWTLGTEHMHEERKFKIARLSANRFTTTTVYPTFHWHFSDGQSTKSGPMPEREGWVQAKGSAVETGRSHLNCTMFISPLFYR